MSALEYRADLYDVIHGRRQHDIPWYVELARHVGGRVLELGAGTGRTALPVARAGIAIDALDVAEEMRAQLRSRWKARRRRSGAGCGSCPET